MSCSIPSCNKSADRSASGRCGLCVTHYRWRKVGKLNWDEPIQERLYGAVICAVADCFRSARHQDGGRKGFCASHYINGPEHIIRDMLWGEGCLYPNCTRQHHTKGYCEVHKYLYYKESYKAKSQRRRSREQNGSFSSTDWLDLLDAYDYCCAYCSVLNESLTADHIIPLSRGGLNTKDNIAPACEKCNKSKGSKTLQE